jgi:hypothetical protein
VSTREKTNDRWVTYETPWVEELPNEPFRYRVESRRGHSHIVDLTERDGHGVCTCEYFQFVARPNHKRHGEWIPFAPGRHGTTECRHIRAALDYFHKHVTMPMLSRLKAGIPKSR